MPQVHHGTCRRCQMPTEVSEVGVGKIPIDQDHTQEVKDLVLCLNCLELSIKDSQTFWRWGWKKN